METLVIHPINEAQQKALQTILDGFEIPYDVEPPVDETTYLTSTKANKDRLDRAMEDYKAGKGKKINTDDLWK